jgi:hypothetical protein
MLYYTLNILYIYRFIIYFYVLYLMCRRHIIWLLILMFALIEFVSEGEGVVDILFVRFAILVNIVLFL